VLLLVCLLLGVVLAWLLGANIGRVGELRFRRPWTVFTALAIQLVIFTPLQNPTPQAAVAPLHVLSYGLIAVFLFANLRIAGMPLVTAGWAANTIAIVANHGRMPISLRDWQASGRAARLLTQNGTHNNNIIADHSHLAWLGDIFPLPSGLPLTNSFSIGDVLIVAGAIVIVALGTRPPARSKRDFLAPLTYPRFVGLLTGRGLSQAGDWITISAAVTWIFHSTGSTWWVSAFMIARLSAFLVGGALGHRFLGQPGSERFGTLLVGRAILTSAALAGGAHGSVLITVAFLVLSAVLAPSTNAGSGSLVPRVVPSQLLHRANALNGFTLELGMIAGTALGGILEARLGLVTPLALDTATFVAAAFAFARISVEPGEEDEPEPLTSKPSFISLSRTLFADRTARLLVVSFALVTAGFGTLNSSLPSFLSRLHESDKYGVGMACLGAGAMVGGLLVGSMSQSRAIRRSVPLAFFGTAATLALFARSEVSTTAYLALILTGALDATTEVSYSTLMQQRFNARQLAAVLTHASSYINAGMIGGFLIAGLASEALAPQEALLMPVVASGLAGLVALRLALGVRPRAIPVDNATASLARGLLDLPVVVRTSEGRRVAIVAERDGRWLAYGLPGHVGDQRQIDLTVPGYALKARAAGSRKDGAAWLRFDAVNRVKPAAQARREPSVSQPFHRGQ
jgi:MFS family permease